MLRMAKLKAHESTPTLTSSMSRIATLVFHRFLLTFLRNQHLRNQLNRMQITTTRVSVRIVRNQDRRGSGEKAVEKSKTRAFIILRAFFVIISIHFVFSASKKKILNEV